MNVLLGLRPVAKKQSDSEFVTERQTEGKYVKRQAMLKRFWWLPTAVVCVLLMTVNNQSEFEVLIFSTNRNI